MNLLSTQSLPLPDAPLIALVAGEASGDLLGAGLMAAIKRRIPNVRFIGVGGPKMESEGLSSLFPMERLSVMGLTEVLGRLPELLKRRAVLIRDLISAQPDVFIGIDAPDFNLTIEMKLRNAGIKTVHYVSPSVWAWKQKRIFKIKKACDLMLTLFPFEVSIYEQHNIPVRFVGHPLADVIPLTLDRSVCRKQLHFADDALVVALMPGSRGGEVAKLAPIFFETARKIMVQFPNVSFVLPCANQARRVQLEEVLKTYPDVIVTLLDGQSQLALGACDAVLIASGTATLEALLCERPMVVAYRLSALTFAIVKRIIKTPYVSLPNLLAGCLLVPELLQNMATADNLFNELKPLLEGKIAGQVDSFKVIHHSLRQNASEQAADAILHMIQQLK